MHLQVPLFIRGRDAHGEQFLELAKTLDISGLGAFLTCPRALAINEVVTLTIPAPSITSSALVPAGMPPIQARVKRRQEAGDVHLMGVEFLKPAEVPSWSQPSFLPKVVAGKWKAIFSLTSGTFPILSIDVRCNPCNTIYPAA